MMEPTPPTPPSINGSLKKLKRKTKSLAGNWTTRWFFVDPKRREFGYADSKTSAPRSSIYLDDITAIVQFDDTHFQVESRTRSFFLWGESKASTACWVTSLESYRKQLIEYEKKRIAYVTATATSALAQASTVGQASTRDVRKKKKKMKTSRYLSELNESQPESTDEDEAYTASPEPRVVSSNDKSARNLLLPSPDTRDRDRGREHHHRGHESHNTRAPNGRGPVMQAWVDDF